MSIIKSIGDKIKSILSKDSGSAIDKIAFTQTLEDLSDSLTDLASALQNKAVVSKLALLIKNKGTSTSNSESVFKESYIAYFSKLTGKAQQIERRAPLEAIKQTALFGSKDLDDLRDNLDNLLGDGADIPLTNLRFSGITVLSYVSQLDTLFTWANFLINAALSSESPAPYLVDNLNSETSDVVSVVNLVLNRGNASSFLDQINTIRNSSQDMNVSVGGHTIDNFATDNDFSPSALSMSAGFIKSPALALGRMYAQHQKAKSDRLKLTRDWLRNRVALLQMDMNKADVNSAEYKRLQKIVDNYNEMIVAQDQKIARYENSR